MSADAAMPIAPLTPQDVRILWSLLPATALGLIDALGCDAALALMNAWPGVELKVPRNSAASSPGARRWARISALIGEEATQRLAGIYGGGIVAIPTCKRARDEKRNRLIRGDFDRLTTSNGESPALSRDDAIQEVGMRYAPISSRQLESILNRADAL